MVQFPRRVKRHLQPPRLVSLGGVGARQNSHATFFCVERKLEAHPMSGGHILKTASRKHRAPLNIVSADLVKPVGLMKKTMLFFTIVLTTIILSGCATQRPPTAGTSWEYQTKLMARPGQGDYVNRFATNGWEIVSIAPEPRLRHEDSETWIILLRRPSQN